MNITVKRFYQATYDIADVVLALEAHTLDGYVLLSLKPGYDNSGAEESGFYLEAVLGREAS